MAEGTGFEPAVPQSTHAFQACTLDHSDILPQVVPSRIVKLSSQVIITYFEKIYKFFWRSLRGNLWE